MKKKFRFWGLLILLGVVVISAVLGKSNLLQGSVVNLKTISQSNYSQTVVNNVLPMAKNLQFNIAADDAKVGLFNFQLSSRVGAGVKMMIYINGNRLENNPAAVLASNDLRAQMQFDLNGFEQYGVKKGDSFNWQVEICAEGKACKRSEVNKGIFPAQ